MLVPGDDSAVELISLWVTPSARGHGAGDAGVRCVLDGARREPGRDTVFRSVKEQSEPAVRLYFGTNLLTLAAPRMTPGRLLPSNK